MTSEGKWKYSLYGACFALAVVTMFVQLPSKEPSGAAVFWTFAAMLWATFATFRE